MLQALLAACKHRGISICADDWHADAVVIWSVLWAGRMAGNRQVYTHYRSQNKPVIVAEVGALRRGHTWKISLNNVNAQGYYGHQQELDPNRMARLGVSLVHPTRRMPHVLVACQHTHSLQVQHAPSIGAWVQTTVRQIQKYTDRPIIVRPHPRSPVPDLPALTGATVQLPKQLAGTVDDFDINFDCHAVVNFNSGPGIQAAFCHTPVIVDATSLAYPIAINIQEIDEPPKRDLAQWALEIAHTEYLISEIESGSWFTRLGLHT